MTEEAQIEKALENGQNIDEERDGTTPLIAAIKDERIAIVLSLLKHGANPNHCPRKSWTPLIWACKTLQLDLVQALIEAGANVNHKEEEKGKTALIVASEEDGVKVVDFLLCQGADKDDR